MRSFVGVKLDFARVEKLQYLIKGIGPAFAKSYGQVNIRH